MVETITATYEHDNEDWTITVSGQGKELTARAPGIIAARDRADQLVEKLAPNERPTVVHLLNGNALEFTSTYMAARLTLPEQAPLEVPPAGGRKDQAGPDTSGKTGSGSAAATGSGSAAAAGPATSTGSASAAAGSAATGSGSAAATGSGTASGTGATADTGTRPAAGHDADSASPDAATPAADSSATAGPAPAASGSAAAAGANPDGSESATATADSPETEPVTAEESPAEAENAKPSLPPSKQLPKEVEGHTPGEAPRPGVTTGASATYPAARA
ncbi:hypothetical protein GCM10022222_69170 [Amycolatopsis ultiminotia]|uniref:Uncharacterized protein n=1 Tax=Amycolatopsis ultiminotia TaxID=543629 RepID=A0ABP6Y1P8_9PSEU